MNAPASLVILCGMVTRVVANPMNVDTVSDKFCKQNVYFLLHCYLGLQFKKKNCYKMLFLKNLDYIYCGYVLKCVNYPGGK